MRYFSLWTYLFESYIPLRQGVSRDKTSKGEVTNIATPYYYRGLGQTFLSRARYFSYVYNEIGTYW